MRMGIFRCFNGMCKGLLKLSMKFVSGLYKLTLLGLSAFSTIAVTGCSFLPSSGTYENQWLESGSLALSRPIPHATTTLHTDSATSTPEAFAPAEAPSLIISRNDRTITAIKPGATPVVIKSEGAQYLKQGSFSVTQKEESPLWYAPKEYFINRALPVPAEGSRERFKRAALGAHTLYLNDQTPIHSGPVWLKEIGGVRVKNAQLAEIFSLVQVGTRVEVR